MVDRGDRGGGRVALGLGGFSLRAAERLVVVNERSVLRAHKREDEASASVAKVRHASRLIDGMDDPVIQNSRIVPQRRGQRLAEMPPLTDNSTGVGPTPKSTSVSRVHIRWPLVVPACAIQQNMMFCKLPALFGAIAFYLALVHAHPIWNIFNTRNSIDSFVTGSSPLLAGIKFGATHYLTTPRPPGTSAVL